MKRVVLVLLINLLLTGVQGFAWSFQSSQPLVGCYSDLSLIENEGLVVGNGSFRIRRRNSGYSATFTELISDGGEYAPTKRVRNFRVDEKRRMIFFDLPLRAGILRHVQGRLTSNGIKMNWPRGGEYGEAKPLFHRRAKNCT